MHKKLKKSVLATACAVALLGMAVAPVSAAEWTGNGTDDWFDVGSWNPATVPGALTDVIIDTDSPNATEISGADAQANNVTVGNQVTAIESKDAGCSAPLR